MSTTPNTTTTDPQPWIDPHGARSAMQADDWYRFEPRTMPALPTPEEVATPVSSQLGTGPGGGIHDAAVAAVTADRAHLAPMLSAAAHLANIFDGLDIFDHTAWTCSEADAIAGFLRAMGHETTAAFILREHAEGDDLDEDDDVMHVALQADPR